MRKKISHQITALFLALLMPFSAFGQGVYFARPAAASSGYSAEVLADSPVVYYRLGESSGTTATDSSGNGRNGTYNTGSFTFGVAGATTDGNTAITKGAFASYTMDTGVNAPATPGSSSFTIEVFIKKNGNPGTVQIIVGKFSGSGNDFFLGITTGGKAIFSVNGTSVAGSTTITDDTWRHIVAVKNGTDLKVYVNGSSDATPVAFTSSTSPGGNLTLGSYSTSGGFYFQSGSLDEFAFYMSALSSTRISDHYNAR